MKYDIKSIEKRKKKEVMIKNVLKVILILLIYNMILLGISAMDNNENIKAQTILEINESHPIAQKIKDLYQSNKDELEEYTKVLYAQARLIEGLPIENPTEISNLICNLISK